MEPYLAIGLFSAFLVFFLFIAGKNMRQEDQSGIEKDTEFITQRTISEKLVPAVIDLFEHEPLEYGEDDVDTVDKLSTRLQPAFKTIATAYKYQEVARQCGRYLLRCGVAGLITEIIFIALIVGFGTGTPLIATTFSISFFIFALCITFLSIRRRNEELAEDLKEKV